MTTFLEATDGARGPTVRPGPDPSKSGERESAPDHGGRVCARRAEPAPVVLTAQPLVAVLRRRAPRPAEVVDVSDDDHVALGDHPAVLGACVVGRPLAAPAQ